SHSKISNLDSLDMEFILLCPEEAGGLGTPRPAAELNSSANEVVNGTGEIVRKSGTDVTTQFINGSKKELSKLKLTNSKIAVLKSRSPSCGYGEIYDGSFTGNICKGNGIFS
ncbi:MAG: DUF523 domain-containing protein, partial [Candidatus Marinimicrobia bacterium]|nr:DUF523 domain-containing protein [Candidatus Neomarinimicrobiota bacterium]